MEATQTPGGVTPSPTHEPKPTSRRRKTEQPQSSGAQQLGHVAEERAAARNVRVLSTRKEG